MTASTISRSVASSGALPLLGSQVPRIKRVPDYVTSAGQEVVELAAMPGLNLDPWEQLVLIDALGERADGKWAAYEVGLVVPRQNGKDVVLEARELGGLFLFGEKLLIHSAHEQATATEHFLRLLNLIESVPDFDRRVMSAPKGKGAEAIILRGSGRGTRGARIFFKTRTGGGGRGFTGDLVVLNEAMILPAAFTGALVPTMAARSIEGNPQLWYAGSPVDQTVHEHGVVLSRVRQRAIDGAARLAYFEWSIDADTPDELDPEVAADPKSWAQANPGMGIRISTEHIENEHNGALGPREFAVERLAVGDWPNPEPNADTVIDIEEWNDLIDSESKIVGRVCFAFDVTPDRKRAAITASGRRADGKLHVEVVEHKRGTHWIVDRIVALVEKHDAATVKCDGKSPAASFVPELREREVPVEEAAASELAQACGRFFDGVTNGQIHHGGTPELEAAIRGAAKRSLGDAWAWSRRSSAVDISPLVAGTLSTWDASHQVASDASRVPVFH